MSRIGKKPVTVPGGVTAAVNGQEVKVKGPKGELKHVLVDDIIAKLDNGGIEVAMREDTQERARHVGHVAHAGRQSRSPASPKASPRSSRSPASAIARRCRATMLQLQLGYSHDVIYPIPQGIQIVCPKPTEIVITGIDKQKVGQVAAEIRRFRPPEPYKGKGIKYAGEFILRKEGKKK